MLTSSQAAPQVHALLTNAMASAGAGDVGTAWSLWQRASAIAGATSSPQAFNQQLSVARMAVAKGPAQAHATTPAGLGYIVHQPRVSLGPLMGDFTSDGLQLANVQQAGNAADEAIAAGNVEAAQQALTYMQNTVNQIGDPGIAAQAQLLTNAETAKFNQLGPQQITQNQASFQQIAATQTNNAATLNADTAYVNSQGNLASTSAGVQVAGTQGSSPNTFAALQNVLAGGPGGSTVVNTAALPGALGQALGTGGTLSGIGSIFSLIPWQVWAGGAALWLLSEK